MEMRRLLGKGFGRVIEAMKGFSFLRLRVPHSSLIHVSLLLLILFIAFMVRLLPLRWGFYLSEFDPYYQYRLAKHMVENGFFAWTSWHDTMSWYPYGRAIPLTSFPGLALTAAFFYVILRALGLPLSSVFAFDPLTSDPLFNFCVIFPVIMGTVTCLVIYFLGKDIGGKEVGLFSAFFLALNSSYIGRTSLGFFDDETVGIFGILLFILFFLRSIETERPFKTSLIYGIAAGLSLGYLFSSWGAARYPVGVAVLLVFVMLLLRRYSSRLLFSYCITFGIALFIAINVPFLGFRFLIDLSILPVSGIFLLLCACEVTSRIKTLKMKAIFVLVFLALSAVSVFMILNFGYFKPLETKYLAVLNPFERLVHPLVQSVQEHRPSAWGSFYYDFGVGIFFIPVGLFFALQNPTNRNIFLSIFGLTSIYFAGSMVRLTLLMAPALCLLWALALIRLLRPFVTIFKGVPAIRRRRTRLEAYVGKEFSGAFLIMMLLLLTLTFVLPTQRIPYPRVFDHAYSPTTIASASVPLKPDETIYDWLETLNWMRENLPTTAVVASWWDYGYWITTVSNKTTLVDNGTWNWTQIGRVASMFMSNETEAIKILEKYDATHVLVFVTFYYDGIDWGWGDEAKWKWMARIAGLNESSYGEQTATQDGRPYWEWNTTPGQDTVIYKLMTSGKETKLYGYSPSVSLENFKLVYFSKGSAIKGAYYALVCVYEIRYSD